MKKMLLIFSLVSLSVLILAVKMLSSEENSAQIFREIQEKNKAIQSDTLDIDDIRVHYVSNGNDSLAPLIFVHGSPGSWADFKEYLSSEALLERFRVIILDRPGFGASSHDKAFTLAEQTQYLGHFMQKVLKGQKAILVGHSLGGPLVANLGVEFPELTKHLLIVGGALDPELEAKESWRKWVQKPWAKKMLSSSLYNSNQELIYLKTDLWQLKEKLSLLKAPVSILHAQNDMLVDVKNRDFMRKHFSNIYHDTLLATGNHFLPFNNSALLIQEILAIRN